MSESDFRSAVVGEARLLRRLAELQRRLVAIHFEIDANEREYQELQRRQEIVLGEHAELRARVHALQEARS